MLQVFIHSLFLMIAVYSFSAQALTRRILSNSFVPTSNRVKVAIFDADGTLRVAPSGKVSANGRRDYFLLPFVTEKISQLNQEGALVVIFSNQLGIGRHVSMEEADEVFDTMRKLISHFNPLAEIHYHDFAESNNEDRKPGTGMIERLERELQSKFGAAFPGISIDKDLSFVCGDAAYKNGQLRPDGTPGNDISDSDRMLALNYGIEFRDPADFFEWVVRGGPIRFNKKSEVDDYFAKNSQYFLRNQNCPSELKSEIPDFAKRKSRPN